MDHRSALKWTFHGPDVIGAWVAEMDFGLAPPIAEALHEAVDQADTGYLYPTAWTGLAIAATDFWEQRLGWRVDPGRVGHVPDVIEGIKRSIIHLTRPDSAVILHPPVYHPFFPMVEATGRRQILVASQREHGRWHLDLDRIDRAFAGGAGSIVLCNPWNPVGRSLTAGEVAEVVTIAQRHGGRVIADEVHAALTYPGSTHVVAASISPETVITVTAASKAWNIPGLKAAQVVLTNDADTERWAEHFPMEKWGVGTLGLIAGAAAYRHGTPWLDEVMARLAANRALLADLVADRLPAAGFVAPEATYLGWIDLGAYPWDPPAAVILERARVATSEGAQFGPGGEGHVRFNFAMAEADLVEAVERIAAVVDR